MRKLKHLFTAIVIGIIMISVTNCADELEPVESGTPILESRAHDELLKDVVPRLSFANNDELLRAINFDESMNRGRSLERQDTFVLPGSLQDSVVGNFQSMVDTRAFGSGLSVYEAQGYDTLVPNIRLARLLNVKGELAVRDTVYRITSDGTFSYPVGMESEFESFLEDYTLEEGTEVAENYYSFNIGSNRDAMLFRTYKEDELIDCSGGGISSDEDLDSSPTEIPEPKESSFPLYYCDRKTDFGHWFQKWFGTTKTITINFNEKRRVRGSLYYYNYIVYKESGVKGWTDKKTWIGWHKTDADELRVGWRKIVLRRKTPEELKSKFNTMKEDSFFGYSDASLNGRSAKINAVYLHSPSEQLMSTFFAFGFKAIMSYVKKMDKNKNLGLNQEIVGDGVAVATPEYVYFFPADHTTIKFNEDYYCHFFSKEWMIPSIGYDFAGNGFILGGANISNNSSWKSIFKAIGKIVSSSTDYIEVVNGESMICARFGTEWRGMRIHKKH